MQRGWAAVDPRPLLLASRCVKGVFAMNDNIFQGLVIAATLSLGLASPILLTPAQSARLPNNRVVFDQAPELVEVTALQSTSGRGEQMQWVIYLPPNAGEPLEAIVVHSRDSQPSITFDPGATVAYVGQPNRPETTAVPLASVGGMMMTPNEVVVVFATPIQPGNQVTVLLTSKNSPGPGTYEFGITAYPLGDNPVGQFLGYERLQF
jgi:hypothetical protein